MPSSNVTICNQRIGIKRKRPNPLFEEWLEELYQVAVDTNSKLTPMLKEALNSISKYPLPLKSGAECAILKGFENRLCKMLDIRLKIYNSEKNLSGEPSDSLTSVSSSEAVSEDFELPSCSGLQTHRAINHIDKENENIDQPSTSQLRTTGVVSPRIKAINNNFSSHTNQICEIRGTEGKQMLSTETSNAIFKQSQNSSKTNKIVNNNESVSSHTSRNLTEYSNETPSTSEGIHEVTDPQSNIIIRNDAGPSYKSYMVDRIDLESSTISPTQSSNVNDIIEMPPGTFEVILLIDKNETSGASKRNDPTVAQFNKYPRLKHEYRSLKVGDFTWIARSKSDNSRELVLPYVVERKRMDDFGSSIKDGRFHEQKFRLRKCGLDNVIYLVENHGRNKHVRLPIKTLMQALANTGVQDGFKIHMTDSLNNSCRFLAMMTKRLYLEYKNRHLKGSSSMAVPGKLMSFDYFNKFSSKLKPLTVKQAFIKLLLQLRGVSVERALAITNKYPTPTALIKAYQSCADKKEARMLLANLKFKLDDVTRNIGPVISRSLYHLFSIKPT